VKVLLINAPVARASLHARQAPPLGIAYVAAAVRDAGHEVEILDLNVSGFNLRRIDNALERMHPDIVGLSAHTETYPNALRIAARVKELSPTTPVIIGGPHPSILPEAVLREPSVDFVAVGEGERTLTELLSAIEAGADADYAAIPGLGYRRDGDVHVNERRTPMRPDEVGSPARDLLPLDFYADPYNVLTARGGCPYRCPFCSASYIWRGVHRQRSAKAVVDEIEELLRDYGARFVFFVDDIFTLDRRWVGELLDELSRLGGLVTWGCATRVDLVDEELLRRMVAAGCTGIQFGVESGSQTILDSVKGIKKEQALAAVQWSFAAGIRTTASFMVPLPDDTVATLRETFGFMRELQAAGAEPMVSYTAPFPGTMFFDHAEELGLRILSDDWEQYDAKHIVMETRDLSAETIGRIVAQEVARLGLATSA
jgi:anaerobic magnesium-protoporphyrin IX monomethyl ester cyclase